MLIGIIDIKSEKTIALYLPKSYNEAIKCIPQIVTWALVENRMKNKGAF